jgi:hypothetical protein
MDQTLPARMAASLAVALAVRGTGESYGLVLKGLNEFAAAAGVTGAAAVRIAHSTNASTPLTMLAHWAPQAGHARATVTPIGRRAPRSKFRWEQVHVDRWKNLATQVAHRVGALHGCNRIASATRVCKLCRRESEQTRRALPGPSETDADVRHVQVLRFCPWPGRRNDGRRHDGTGNDGRWGVPGCGRQN